MTLETYDPSKPLRHGEQQELAFLWFPEAYADARWRHRPGRRAPARLRPASPHRARRPARHRVRRDQPSRALPARQVHRARSTRRPPHWDIVRAPRGNLIQPNGDDGPAGHAGRALAPRLHRAHHRHRAVGLVRRQRPVPELRARRRLRLRDVHREGRVQRHAPRRRPAPPARSRHPVVAGLLRRRRARTMLTWLAEEREHEPLVVHDFDLAGIGIWAKIEERGAQRDRRRSALGRHRGLRRGGRPDVDGRVGDVQVRPDRRC